jgi:hypothetical protein
MLDDCQPARGMVRSTKQSTAEERPMSSTLTADNREKLKKISVATITTALFKRNFRNQFIQDVRPVGTMEDRRPDAVERAFKL